MFSLIYHYNPSVLLCYLMFPLLPTKYCNEFKLGVDRYHFLCVGVFDTPPDYFLHFLSLAYSNTRRSIREAVL